MAFARPKSLQFGLWVYLQLQTQGSTASANWHSSEMAQQGSNQEMLWRGTERQRAHIRILGLLASPRLPAPDAHPSLPLPGPHTLQLKTESQLTGTKPPQI